MRYFGFGLNIDSNRPIPGLLEDTAPARVAGKPLRVILGSMPAIEGQCLLGMGEIGEAGVPAWSVYETQPDSHVLRCYEDGTRFLISNDGAAVWTTWPDHATVEDTATYLLGPIMAFVLKLRGMYSLHAAVVAIDGGAVAIAGPPSAGKSTVAATFAMHGHDVLSDDLAPVFTQEGVFFVHPTYPQVRLWDASATQLFGSPDNLPLLTPNWEKRYFDAHAADRFSREPLPLQAVFFLDEREESAAAPRARALTQQESFISVLGNLHTIWMLPDEPQAPVFALASSLAQHVPAFQVKPHTDASRIDELCALITNVARNRAHV